MINGLRELLFFLIDSLEIVGTRILTFPTVVIFAVIVLVLIVFYGLLWWLGWKRGTPFVFVHKVGWVGLLCLLVVPLVFFEKKLNRLQFRLSRLERSVSLGFAQQTGLELDLEFHPQLVDMAQVKKHLSANFTLHQMAFFSEAPAVEIVSLQFRKPHLISTYVAIIDLLHPAVEVVITPSYQHGKKIYTSHFARAYDCVVAINGEAGESPARNSKFGQWVGNWIVKGKPILLKDSEKRPFLSFDPQNQPRYYKESIVDRTVTPEKFNTIWGRFDLLVNGTAVGESGVNHPRTAMGVTAGGDKLFLMVTDGRQHGYSEGINKREMGEILRAFGAFHAMQMDGGGSSTIYTKRFGVLNQPSDLKERPVYNHFGIRLANGGLITQ